MTERDGIDRDNEVQLTRTLIDVNWREIHHIESQRGTLTNILLVVESAALALVVEGGYSTGTLPLCLLIALLGAVGVLATRKYYERFRYAQRRLTYCYREADRFCADLHLIQGLVMTNEHHAKDRSLYLVGQTHLKELGLNRIWGWVHTLFLAAGLLLAATVLGLYTT